MSLCLYKCTAVITRVYSSNVCNIILLEVAKINMIAVESPSHHVPRIIIILCSCVHQLHSGPEDFVALLVQRHVY